MEPMAVERHRRSPKGERANGASGKRCDIDAARRRSQTEKWEVQVNQSKPKLTYIRKESQTRKSQKSFPAGMEPTGVERHRRRSPRRLSEREKANQSKPKLKHVPECQRLTGLKNRSRRESNPHLRFRKPSFCPLNYGNSDNCDFRFSIADCKLCRRVDTGALLVSFLVRRSGKSWFTQDEEHIPSGNRDPETGIRPMDNFVCWRCEREARGAFMLIGRPAEKWLVKRQRQMELKLVAR